MKSVTLEQMQIIAETYGGYAYKDQDTGNRGIAFNSGEYGFEATEKFDDEYYGFKFFGPSAKQSLPHILKCWSDLTDPAIIGDMLTIERARELISKKIEVSYHDYNEGKERFKIIGMDQRNDKAIGQNKTWYLHTIPIDAGGNELKAFGNKEYEDWVYEWQGIFRRGSGAERLFIEKLF